MVWELLLSQLLRMRCEDSFIIHVYNLTSILFLTKFIGHGIKFDLSEQCSNSVVC